MNPVHCNPEALKPVLHKELACAPHHGGRAFGRFLVDKRKGC
jgi:hypothetical protein